MITILALLAQAAPGPVDFLDLARVPPGPGLPPGWKVRGVMGRSAPAVEVRRDGGERVLRLQGAGKAAWFYRETDQKIGGESGTLRWSWRVLVAPPDADLRHKGTDDSPIRVYVVFGKPRPVFGGSGRVIFYTFGTAEPDRYEGASHAGNRYHIIRVDGAKDRSVWRDHVVDAFADYRRIWRRNPPPITAIGVMQDTDQTNQTAVAELRRLEWTPE